MGRFDISIIPFILKTFYLFTVDDIQTIVLPKTICGVLLPLADTLLQRPRLLTETLPAAPLVFFWVWLNLLFFNVSNQSQPAAILEDAENKPWRPILAGRVTALDVRKYIHVLRLVAICTSFILGGMYPCLILQLLTYLYNDLGGGDIWVFRNPINAGGYLCFIVGAMQVAIGSHDLQYSDKALKWLFLVAMVISTTMHAQDLYDQEGDKLRGRKTIPLVFGDWNARYSIAIPVALWSFLAPAFWSLDIPGFLPSVTLGTIVAARLLRNSRTNVKDDKHTFVCWNIWILSLHMLPLWGHLLEHEDLKKLLAFVDF